MSERSYTPGPWTIEPHGKGFALYSGRDAMHHGMNLVCLSEPDSNWEANARLIAAAPEMFELLETIENDDCAIPAWLWDKIQEVVKRVKGDQ